MPILKKSMRKLFQLDPRKIKGARVLEAKTETETVECARDRVIAEYESNR
jgi:hypothetical protein